MGIATVAVYSDADARAPFVKMADEAVHIGPAPASESYLIADKIIAACKQTGADAVHPGYGFLSERTCFRRGAGGRGDRVHRASGRRDRRDGRQDRDRKKLAKEAGVNVVPGFVGEIDDTEHAVGSPTQIGYPVMMKARAGGGGKGMRLAYDEKDVREGFEATKREGLHSFGDDRVFIEKFILNPRHIEIQILGDKHGNDPLPQRARVLDPAPPPEGGRGSAVPFVTPKMRKAMGEQCVALSKAVGYYSAGTVELIVCGRGPDGRELLLPRDEHPASGRAPGDRGDHRDRPGRADDPRRRRREAGLRQDDIGIDGWAIENRVYAEDPYRGFLPSTGRLSATVRPGETWTRRPGLAVGGGTQAYAGSMTVSTKAAKSRCSTIR